MLGTRQSSVLAAFVWVLQGCTGHGYEQVASQAEVDAGDGGTLIDAGGPDAPLDCAQTSAPAFNLAVDGTVTASDDGDHGPGAARKVFDDNTGSKWVVSANSTPWIAYEFSGSDSHAVKAYAITAAGDGVEGNLTSDPTSWELQGSNDPSAATTLNFTTLDSRPGANVRKPLSHRGVFGRKRHCIPPLSLAGDDQRRATRFQLAELELFGAGTPVFSVDNGARGDLEHQFNYSDGWGGHTVDNASERYNGSSSWSNVAGESFSVTFVGSQVRLYGVKDPKHGLLGISVDGSAEVLVDLYGASTTFNELVYTSPRLCPEPHLLEGRVTGEKNPQATDVFVSVDRVQVVP
jgi:hypothetical protein